MSTRAVPRPRRPSRAASLALILIGAGVAAVWVALPSRHDGANPWALSLLVAEAGQDPYCRAAVAREIAARGDAGLVEVVAALASGAFLDGLPVDSPSRKLCEEALALVEPRSLVSFLERTGPAGDAALRREAMRLVSAYGEPRDTDALLVIACGRGDADLHASAEDLERGLSALIARHPETLGYLPGAWRRAPDAAFRATVRAAGGCRRARGLDVLIEALGRVPDGDGLVLAEIGRLGDVADPERARAAARRVEPYLDAHHPGLSKAAVNTLGRLGSPDSIPDLVDLLEDEDAGLARTAHAALQRLTGLGFRSDPGPWQAWLAAELAWLDERQPAVMEALRADDSATVREALRELLTHPFDRHFLAEEVGRLLEREELDLRLAACDGLRRLGSRAALESLLAALEDEQPEVAEAAHAALVALTGLDLRGEQHVWLEALSAQR